MLWKLSIIRLSSGMTGRLEVGCGKLLSRITPKDLFHKCSAVPLYTLEHDDFY